ncbi:hypothetical protein EBT25_05080 [bacterium]|nr:hypothetical protein [bacterium]
MTNTRCTAHTASGKRCRLPCTGNLNTCNNHVSDCCVCFCPNNKSSLTLSCNHTFHTECISTWFRQNRRCPVCRAYEKPKNVHLVYEEGAPRLDENWLRPMLLDLAEQEVLLTNTVGILASGELVQSNGEFIRFLWGAHPP